MTTHLIVKQVLIYLSYMAYISLFHFLVFLNGAVGVVQLGLGILLHTYVYRRFASDEHISALFSYLAGGVGFSFAVLGYVLSLKKNNMKKHFKRYTLYLIIPLSIHFATALITSLPVFNRDPNEILSLPEHRPGSQIHRMTAGRRAYFRIVASSVTLSCVGLVNHVILMFFSCCYANSEELDHIESMSTLEFANERGRFASRRFIVGGRK